MLFCSALYSQNLTMDELVSLRKKNLASADEYLSNKNWSYFDSNKEENLTLVTYTYKRSLYDDKAESFLYYANYFGYVSITIQVHTTIKYNEYLNKVKSYGAQLVDTHVTDEGISKVYRGKTVTFKITTSTQERGYEMGTSTIYKFSLYDNEMYDIINSY